jgi:cytochrome bd ubiquinol oxidase subunit II
MSVATVLLAVVWSGVTAYAVLGGADFGAGVLHLLAPAGLRGHRRRHAVTSAMGPVWEANHVWLIFVLTGLLTAFPAAFSALGSALLAPASLVLIGLVVRGTALVFSGQLPSTGAAGRALQRAFGLASLATPFLLGTIAGGLARQRIVVEDGHVLAGGGLGLWVGPFQLVVGALAVAGCTALAAAFLTVRAAGDGEAGLARALRRDAQRATVATWVLALAALGFAAACAPRLFHGLTSGRGLPAVVVALVAFGVAVAGLRAGRDRLARAALVVAQAGLVWGWGLAQFPRLVGPRLTVARAAAPAAELHAVAWALAAGAVLLLPSLWLLHSAFRAKEVTG